MAIPTARSANTSPTRASMTIEQVNMPAIRAWLAANPQRLHEVLDSNPSVVFFREAPLEDPSVGPKGALGVPLTAGRSIAVDPKFLPLGAPMFLVDDAARQPTLPLQRLVVAQDTGGAIRGPVRADLFFGFGAEAGAQAGMMKNDGEMWLLWPRAAPPPTEKHLTPACTSSASGGLAPLAIDLVESHDEASLAIQLDREPGVLAGRGRIPRATSRNSAGAESSGTRSRSLRIARTTFRASSARCWRPSARR